MGHSGIQAMTKKLKFKNENKNSIEVYPGFTETLAEPMEGPLMTIEKIHYLYDPVKNKYLDNFDDKAIFIDFHKEFKHSDTLYTSLSFGTLKPDVEFLQDMKDLPSYLKKILNQDLKSQANINTDTDAYPRYMARKVKQSKKDDEMRSVVREVNSLKTEMREIKDLLREIKDGR